MDYHDHRTEKKWGLPEYRRDKPFPKYCSGVTTMDLRREHIYAGFSVLLDSGFRAPFEAAQMNQIANQTRHQIAGGE